MLHHVTDACIFLCRGDASRDVLHSGSERLNYPSRNWAIYLRYCMIMISRFIEYRGAVRVGNPSPKCLLRHAPDLELRERGEGAFVTADKVLEA